MKPRVFISLASSVVGGPGKGLLQFLRAGGLECCDLVLIDFVTHSGPDSEYATAMRDAGANVVGIVQNKRFDFGLVARAQVVVRREKCQILQSHGYKSHVLCALLMLRTGLPWVAFVHGWTAENPRMEFYKFVETGLVTMATRVIAVSQALEARLPCLARWKTTVVPNAVDPAELSDVTGRDVRREYGIASTAKVAGVVGRLSPEKGQVYFLRALAKAREEIPELVGLVVGDGQDRSMLQGEADGLGLGGAVFFIGHVRRMGDYYRAMDVVVLPSFSEGMPNVALEAMLFGKPLVASRVGGVPEVVVEGETGFMVEAGDTEALSLAMRRILTRLDLGIRMGEAG